MRRSIVSSLFPFVVATLGAIAMAFAFPKTSYSILAPLGAAALFYALYGLRPVRAFWTGWIAGFAFFAITFSWFGETAGAEIAPFGFIVTGGPALVESLIGFALPAVAISYLSRALDSHDRVSRALVPLGCAATIAAFEWLRAEGLGSLGVPFGSLGLTQTDTILAPLASYGGTYGITFVICVLGAYAAYALRMRRVRAAGMDATIALLATASLTAGAWIFWPARTVDPPTLPVAAIQGNIAQKIKFVPGSVEMAIKRYTSLTERAALSHPALIVWPETVIPTAMNQNAQLRAQFAALAKASDAELIVGTNVVTGTDAFNALYFFTPDGGLDQIYRKRQLVPFAEHLPFAQLLSWIPLTQEISHFSTGTARGITGVGGLRIGPVICWESAFSDIAVQDVRAGADAFVVSTDDAWFGTTAGPYEHSQISQMRALETGRWIVRAASTGISGIISPDGRYRHASQLSEEAVVPGAIGTPVATAYDSIGALAIGLAAFALAIGVASTGRLRER